MEKTYISIGSGCAAAKLIQMKGLRTDSYPLDWILSYAEFSYNVIKMLSETSAEETFEYFLDPTNNDINAMPTYGSVINYDGGTQLFEKYATTNAPIGGSVCIYNSKQKVTFPHDFDRNEEMRDKYIRRLYRLQQVLFNSNTEANLVYISPSSNETQYAIDGVELTTNEASNWLNKIAELLTSKGSNFNIIFLDALNEEIVLNSNITQIKLIPKGNWFPLITENIINF